MHDFLVPSHGVHIKIRASSGLWWAYECMAHGSFPTAHEKKRKEVRFSMNCRSQHYLNSDERARASRGYGRASGLTWMRDQEQGTQSGAVLASWMLGAGV